MEKLTRTVEQQAKTIEKLTAALDEARRAGKRQAAPFRQGPPKSEPKRPGRKPGDQYGQQFRRAVPSDDEIDETYDVPLPPVCPQCGSRHLHETHVATQYQIELPAKPIQRRFDVHVGCCGECGQLRDPLAHPEQFQDSPIGRIPKSWEFDTFAGLMGKRIITDIQDGNHGESHPKESDYVEDGVPFVMAADIAADEIDMGRCKRIPHALVRRLRIGHARPGDVLLSHKASVGFVAIVRPEHGAVMLTPQVTYYRIGNLDRLDSSFLAWLMRGHRFQRQLESLAAQSTRDYVGITMQKTLTVAIPSSLEEQAAIVAHLTTIQLQLRTEQENLAKNRSLKSGLMTDLLTGRVSVPTDLFEETSR